MGPTAAKAFSVKYYKGLGTSTAAEAKDYFRDPHLVTYACIDPVCRDSLDLAFNKKRADDRKAWLGKYDKDAIIQYGAETKVPFDTFIHRDLIHYSTYDNMRSIPHLQVGVSPPHPPTGGRAPRPPAHFYHGMQCFRFHIFCF